MAHSHEGLHDFIFYFVFSKWIKIASCSPLSTDAKIILILKCLNIIGLAVNANDILGLIIVKTFLFDVLTGRDSVALIIFSVSKLSCVNAGLPKAVRSSTLTAQLDLEN